MEKIGTTLKPYSGHFQNISLLLSIVRFAQGLKFFRRIRQEQIDESLTLKGLLGSLVIGTLNMRIAQMSNKTFICNSHRLTVAFLMGYITMFHYKAVPEIRHYVWRKVPPIIGLIVLCLSYSYMEETNRVKWNLCLIRTATSALLIITGLVRGSCCFGDCCVSVLMALSKLLYELSVHNKEMVYHSFFLFFLDMLRLFKCFMSQSYETTTENLLAERRGAGKPPKYIFMIH